MERVRKLANMEGSRKTKREHRDVRISKRSEMKLTDCANL